MTPIFTRGLAAILLALAALLPVAAPAQSLTDYAENKIVDALMRGQAIGTPATWYVGLMTAASSCETGSVTEVSTSGTNYARVAVTAGLTQWAGTQSAGSTTASSGTGGQTSNNAAITFGAPSGNWGSVTHFGIWDASTSGNLWICQSLTTAKTINSGDAAPSFSAGALTITIQ